MNKHVGRCSECGKLTFTSRRNGKQAARTAHPDEPLRVYACGEFWHYGNTPDWVKHGIEPGRPRLPSPP